jgi:hypothetical protein
VAIGDPSGHRIGEFGEIRERVRDDVPEIRNFSGHRLISRENCTSRLSRLEDREGSLTFPTVKRELSNQERVLHMLNITNVGREVQIENLLIVGVDVSKDKLDLYAEHTDPDETHRQELDGVYSNTPCRFWADLHEKAIGRRV